jgi:hypothetical protein
MSAPGQGEGETPDLQLPVEALPAEALPGLNAEQAGTQFAAAAPLPEAAFTAVHAGTAFTETSPEVIPGREQIFSSEPGGGMVSLAEFATADAGLGLGRLLLFTVGGFALIPGVGRTDKQGSSEWLRARVF